jgi:hypothetical protein
VVGRSPAFTTEDIMTARTVIAGIIAAATLFAASPSAGATQVTRPDPDVVSLSQSHHDRVVQLMADRRNASTVAESYLIHLDLVQELRESE